MPCAASRKAGMPGPEMALNNHPFRKPCGGEAAFPSGPCAQRSEDQQASGQAKAESKAALLLTSDTSQPETL